MTNEKFLSSFSEPFRAILIFGPPGSGKGTLSKFLSLAANHFHLSTGDIFRGLDPDSKAGRLYHQYANKGHLVPDHVTIDIWHNYLQGLINTNRYYPNQQLLLLDGIPRTESQVELIQKHVKVEAIIVLDVLDVDVLIKRLKKRALIEKRSDDVDEDVLKTRMDVYHTETKKILNHFPKKIIYSFNADQKPVQILKDVLVKMTDLLIF